MASCLQSEGSRGRKAFPKEQNDLGSELVGYYPREGGIRRRGWDRFRRGK